MKHLSKGILLRKRSPLIRKVYKRLENLNSVTLLFLVRSKKKPETVWLRACALYEFARKPHLLRLVRLPDARKRKTSYSHYFLDLAMPARADDAGQAGEGETGKPGEEEHTGVYMWTCGWPRRGQSMSGRLLDRVSQRGQQHNVFANRMSLVGISR